MNKLYTYIIIFLIGILIGIPVGVNMKTDDTKIEVKNETVKSEYIPGKPVTKKDTVWVKSIVKVEAKKEDNKIKIDTLIALNDNGFIKLSTDDILSKGLNINYSIPHRIDSIKITDTLKIETIKIVEKRKPFYDTFTFGFVAGVVCVGAIVIAAL